MRRVLAAAGVGVALLAVTACGTSKDTSSSPTAAASSAAADHTANSKDVCTEINTTLNGVNDTAGLQKAVQDAMAGKKTQAEQQAAALMTAKAFLVQVFAKLKDVAAKAEDPELKAALLKIEADFEGVVTSMKSLDDDIDGKMKALDATDESKKVTTICSAAGVTLSE
ncbi:hypothetical protein [Hamadaea tsunoensis]|uniref:hypothetical protein n=1 Tax=Hamadaea tsunoensis TaxID=53368 RepID=UPI0004028301|nr:hypothetical protein [Hamadaea tsunoensis]